MTSSNVKLNTRPIARLLAIFDIVIDDVEIDNIVLDSRNAKHGSLFIAQQGIKENGSQYIDDALSKGAELVLVDAEDIERHGKIEHVDGVQVINFFELDKQLGFICSAFHQHVTSILQCVAVTGTNGKTSVAHLCAQLSASCNESAGTIGTMGVALYVQNQAPVKISETINTTPDVASMHEFSHLLKHQGARRLCIEASSHGLHQNRLSAFNIEVAAFTNLTQDHLDYHSNFEDYAAAKRLLLQQPGLRYLVINGDDKESHNWLNETPEHTTICLCSVKHTSADSLLDAYCEHQHQLKFCLALNPQYTSQGSTFDIESSWGSASVSLPLIGQFNIANVLTAFSALLLQGLSFDSLIKALSSLQGVPGRMEVFKSFSHGNIIVDYAHTPDALEQALTAARKHVSGSLTVVFGCGGDRDHSKRSLMGSIAEKCADKVVLTQDNSRNEDLENIITDIQQGIKDTSKLKIISKRTDAIEQAYLDSQVDDLILVAGKGHEEYLELNSVREYYNEREYVKQLTMELRG